MRIFLIFLSNILLIFGFPWEGENLCKRKPYLIFCQEQNAEFFHPRQQASDAVNSRPNFKTQKFNDDHSPLERPLLPAKESESAVEESETHVEAKKNQKPIDLSRPNAEDVAREMGEIQRDEEAASPSSSTTTESNEVFERSSTSTQIQHNPFFSRTFFRHKRSTATSPSPSSSSSMPARKSTPKKRQHDWVYLDDTDDLDYIEYRKRRARLLRKLNELDDDQQLRYIHRRIPSSSSSSYSGYSAYEGYGYPYSSYYPSNYYPSYYPSYGYPSSDYYSNPGYLGGYGYRQPFTFGIGSGINIGLPYGQGIGIGSGLGVTVG